MDISKYIAQGFGFGLCFLIYLNSPDSAGLEPSLLFQPLAFSGIRKRLPPPLTPFAARSLRSLATPLAPLAAQSLRSFALRSLRSLRGRKRPCLTRSLRSLVPFFLPLTWKGAGQARATGW